MTLVFSGNGCASVKAAQGGPLGASASPAGVVVVPVDAVEQQPNKANPSSSPLSSHEPRIRFDAFEKSVSKNCVMTPEEETTLGFQEAAAHSNECLADAVTDALKDAATRDGANVRALNALHDDLVQDLCWLSEELVWIDLDEGSRDTGSLRNFQWLSCERKQHIEQAFLLRTMELHDANGFGLHVRASQEAGKMEQNALEKNNTKAKALLARPTKKPVVLGETPYPIEDDAKKELVQRIQSISDRSKKLATMTCSTFVGLESELGGGAACKEKVALYYSARAYLGDSGL